MDTYNPATISDSDCRSILDRVDRYITRHGSEYGETPVPGGDREEARAVIVTDWQSADWEAMEWTYLQRNGRPLFTPDLSDLGRHLRAALFVCGRARRRGWVESGPMRRAARVESRRREMDDSHGASMASRAADPAMIVAAVEDAQRAGLRSTPDRFARRRLRWVKTRNAHGHYLVVVRREHDRTAIEWREWTRYNFRVAGDLTLRVEDNAHYVPVHGIGRVVRSRPNPAVPRTVRRVPAGWTVDTLREAITG